MTRATSKSLAALGAEELAAALLELADRNEDAARLVARLVAGPDDGGRRFKAGLAALRRRNRFVPYREAGAYAAELKDLLEDLEAGVRDPRAGAELVAAFYRSDAAIFEACDDSDGLVGDVFRLEARDLFQHYAARCDDKEWLAECIFGLLGEDDYGVRDALLLRVIHGQLGHRDLVEELVWKRFHQSRCSETPQDLLQVIGQERRDEVVAHAWAAMLQAKEFSVGDAVFLMECGRMDEAARYVLERRAQLDGDQWSGLVPLAESLDASGRFLAAAAVYRALLDSILGRGKSHTYHHGARYLHRLGALAGSIGDWDGVTSHAEYLAGLHARHGRKSSFWALASRQEA
jgi:hypothetical protein